MSNRTTLAQLVEMPREKVATLPLEQIAMLLEDLAAERARLALIDGMLAHDLNRRFADKAQQLRRAENKDSGTVTLLTLDGFKVKADLPKKVDWDQASLRDAVKKIESWGEDPRHYVSIEIKVSEAKFNAWPPSIRDVFMPARTVSAGKPSYKLETIKEAA